MRKIAIIGTTGSGKSTLAKKISQKLQIPYIQLDELFWKPNWEESSDEEFFEKIRNSIAGKPSWVIDGNYTRTQHITWSEADTVVWINFPFWLTFYQNFTRTFMRSLTKKELWEGTGNKESFSKMFSRDSILIWLFRSYGPQIQRNLDKMNNPEYGHIKFYRLRTRSEVKEFLASCERT